MVCRSDKVQRLSLPLITIKELQSLSYVERPVYFNLKVLSSLKFFELFFMQFTKIEIMVLIILKE